MVKYFAVGCPKGPRHCSSHRTLRDEREAAVHVRISGMQQALLQTLSPTDAQSQTHRYRELQKEMCVVLQIRGSQSFYSQGPHYLKNLFTNMILKS